MPSTQENWLKRPAVHRRVNALRLVLDEPMPDTERSS
jgi:hypothetical protein